MMNGRSGSRPIAIRSLCLADWFHLDGCLLFTENLLFAIVSKISGSMAATVCELATTIIDSSYKNRPDRRCQISDSAQSTYRSSSHLAFFLAPSRTNKNNIQHAGRNSNKRPAFSCDVIPTLTDDTDDTDDTDVEIIAIFHVDNSD